MAALLGAIANIDRLAAFRRDCERGFSLAMSTKSNQCQSDFFLKKVDTCRLLSLIRCKLQRFRCSFLLQQSLDVLSDCSKSERCHLADLLVVPFGTTLGAHTYGLRRRAAWNDARMLGGPARGRRHLSRAACSAPYWALLCKVRQRAIRKTLPRDDPIRKIHKVAG